MAGECQGVNVKLLCCVVVVRCKQAKLELGACIHECQECHAVLQGVRSKATH